MLNLVAKKNVIVTRDKTTNLEVQRKKLKAIKKTFSLLYNIAWFVGKKAYSIYIPIFALQFYVFVLISLSGGMKRKVNLGIALIGDSKV